MNLAELAEPFPAEDIEWRIGRCGQKGKIWAMALAYITARAIHDRLDAVCGPDKWQLRYKEHLGETVCEIGINVGSSWIWKAGGGDQTQFEAFKGGLSSAEKRAGVPWGIGRYLYNLDETFVETSVSKVAGWKYQAKNEKKGVPAFYWKIPDLPKWALPEGGGKKAEEEVELLDLDQVTVLQNEINKRQINLEDMLKYLTKIYGYKIEEVADLHANHYDRVTELVEKKPLRHD
jgi:hypothetical protein